MLHGYGKRQRFLTKTYQEKRNRALEDRTRYTQNELEELEITEPGQGAGRTNDKTYQIWQSPYPIDNSIRPRKKIDIRTLPEIGD